MLKKLILMPNSCTLEYQMPQCTIYSSNYQRDSFSSILKIFKREKWEKSTLSETRLDSPGVDSLNDWNLPESFVFSFE